MCLWLRRTRLLHSGKEGRGGRYKGMTAGVRGPLGQQSGTLKAWNRREITLVELKGKGKVKRGHGTAGGKERCGCTGRRHTSQESPT